ncbi:hypothetical protein CVT24_008549 [Panaeolus cyanescens]|uniref:BTB domain-containing protein n=1 Tax=Panaeolus cyanescens TaxID=181874 RepID=A0A409VDP4_9AGAR|nr:hypothetical protein CVT24_008549 [Panaeolus cyanescens]
MTSSSTTGFQNLQHHDKYFIHSADLYVIAEKTLFKVHSHFLTRESAKFEDEVNQLEVSTTSADRSPTPKVIALHESVKAAHFEKLLSVFYPEKYSYEKPVEDWEVILAQAVKWSFNEVKELCIRELSKDTVSVATRLAIFEANNLESRYTRTLYGLLCADDLPLTLAEMEKLGLKATYIIMTARERLRSSGEGGRSPLSPERRSDVGPTLRSVFQTVDPVTATSPTTPTNGAMDKNTAANAQGSSSTGQNVNKGNSAGGTSNGNATANGRAIGSNGEDKTHRKRNGNI